MRPRKSNYGGAQMSMARSNWAKTPNIWNIMSERKAGRTSFIQRNVKFVMHPSDVICLGIRFPCMRAIDEFEAEKCPHFLTFAEDHRQRIELALICGNH